MLTPQQLAEAVEYLRAHGLTGGSEKRRATRMQVQAKIQAGRLVNGRVVHSFSLLTKDISMLGLGLIQGIHVDAGTELLIVLPRMKGEPLYMKMLVRHCRDLADNLYSVGTEFLSEVPPDLAKTLQKLGDAEQQRLSQSILD
ncbi:MAG TPA: hypothetical protein VFE58_13645 [Tepidisphaeraceae bacterium]|jgi:hypothetical protein|nr:hypothetical protein [Tepidisphaeraceae bacterium]